MSKPQKAQTTPLRNRQNLHLNLDPSTPTPTTVTATVPDSQFQRSPFGLTSLASSSYSPFRSAWLKSNDPFESPLAAMRQMKKQPRWTVKSNRLFNARNIVAGFLLVAVVCWLQALISRGKAFRSGFDWQPSMHIFRSEVTRGMHFLPAMHPLIHYVGRWVPTPNRLRIDGTFPGVYFDLNVTNTSTVLLSLKNSADAPSSTKGSANSSSHNRFSRAHLSFQRSGKLEQPSPSVPLVARVNQEEYVVFANASKLVKIADDLDTAIYNTIRVVLPLTNDVPHRVIQFEGLWLGKSGRLSQVEGAVLAESMEEINSLNALSAQVGRKHQEGLDAISRSDQATNGGVEADELSTERKKVLEILTDAPGSMVKNSTGHRSGGADGILSGVMGWEYLIGDMFDIDLVTVAADRTCLMQECKGGFGAPEGFGDVFFRSGPPESRYFEYPWMFDGVQVPDVMVINLGETDAISFSAHQRAYKEENRTLWDLQTAFEDTYVSLVKSIRQLAYPTHPSALYYSSKPANNPANTPIFIMRPLTGALEHASLGVASRLRMDGDSSVFWLDTSGWLEAPPANISSSPGLDYWIDDSVEPAVPRLTELGNQRVAIFLHEHVCRYLAQVPDECAFLAPDVYTGKGFVPEEPMLERVMETEREKKLRQIFGIV